MDIPILFEDESILAVNKPPGIVVNRSQTAHTDTLQDWAEKRLNLTNLTNLTNDYFQRAGIVHRLDKETSGVLLIAKTPAAFEHLQKQFKDRVIKKTYLALVHGNVVPSKGSVNAPVGRLPWNRERFGILPGGKDALTKYQVLKRNEKYSLIELHPESGRTHQIRVHMKYINHPVVCDYLYAGRKTYSQDKLIFTRVMLHAWKITFVHPVAGSSIDLEAPVPSDIASVIQ